MTHSGRFSPEKSRASEGREQARLYYAERSRDSQSNPEQRVTLSLQSPLMGCTPKNPTERSSLELCSVYLLVTTDRQTDSGSKRHNGQVTKQLNCN